MTSKAGHSADIRVGIGGWTYAPWRDNFYPKGLPQRSELAYAGERLNAIEINATYHGSQKPESFARWRDETPDDFVFSVKASRYATNRRVLAEAGESIDRFVDGGLTKLGAKLGPIVWQFAPTKHFEPEDFEAFVARLPTALDGRPLRHVLDVRNASFMCPAYLALARKYQAATVFTDSPDYPSFADLTAGFVYARLMCAEAHEATGYRPDALTTWARAAQAWAGGGEPTGLPRVEPAPTSNASPRPVFVFFINGAKERAPAAAMALRERLR